MNESTGMLKAWSGARRQVPVPAGRDPFVNTPLLALGPGEDGAERFWISTWNANVGCLALLVKETGEVCVHRFEDGRHGGFYSAVKQDEETLWLCGNLSQVLRFSLRTGKYEVFETGAPPALVFQGMTLDRDTGKLFALANVLPQSVVTAFSFDTRRLRTAQIHAGIADDKYMRVGFPNGDGSHTFVLHIPGETLLHWDPQTETVQAARIGETLDTHAQSGGTTYRLIADAQGRRYFPRHGWYDGRRRAFDGDGPRPEREMTWFHRVDATAWGADSGAEGLKIGRWDMATGKVQALGSITDAGLHNVNGTADGKIIAVNTYGCFYRFDGQTGAMEMTRRLPADSIGRADCLCRIDADRLLGTPFITQRFWEANIRTGKGYDCGRAAPGAGQIQRIWKIGGKVYMAAYAGGELVEYAPDEHPHFPENPRVVATPPNSNRPVAAADDGRHLFYACSAPYGNLGSTLTRYDTVTGAARYAVNPLPEQMIVSLWHDRATDSLVCGTHPFADCGSCPPRSDRGLLARIDAGTLAVIEQMQGPENTQGARVEGPLGEGRYLCSAIWLANDHPPAWFTISTAPFARPEGDSLRPFPEGTRQILYAGRPGFFLLRREARVEVWDMRRAAPVLLIDDAFGGYAVKLQDDTVYLLHPREIKILEGCLGGLD